jgi:hypothetical protein
MPILPPDYFLQADTLWLALDLPDKILITEWKIKPTNEKPMATL